MRKSFVLRDDVIGDFWVGDLIRTLFVRHLGSKSFVICLTRLIRLIRTCVREKKRIHKALGHAVPKCVCGYELNELNELRAAAARRTIFFYRSRPLIRPEGSALYCTGQSDGDGPPQHSTGNAEEVR
jgi:hypothetical protein